MRKIAIVVFLILLRIAENYNFLYIPIVSMYFEMAPKRNQMTDFLQTTVGVKYIRLKKPTNHSPQFNARKSFKTQKVLGGLFFDKY